MKDVAVVRDVLPDAVSVLNDITKTYEEIKKVEELKVRVLVPGFERDLFVVKCVNNGGILMPKQYFYNPPEYQENNNLIKPFPTLTDIRNKIQKYVKKEVKRQFEGTKSPVIDRLIMNHFFKMGIFIFGDTLEVNVTNSEGFMLPLPENQSSIQANITKTSTTQDGRSLVEAAVILHLDQQSEFIGNKHLWLFALERFMEETMKQKVAEATGDIKEQITSIGVDNDDPF